MSTTDGGLDARSRKLLGQIDDLRRLEREKRGTARSTGDFHDLAEEVDATARQVFDSAHRELRDGNDDSPIPAERDEQHPGDWTDGNRH